MAIESSSNRADAHASPVGRGPRSGRAVLVGCGNIGSHAAIDLATRGHVASLCIVDRDVVEPRNVDNQFYALLRLAVRRRKPPPSSCAASRPTWKSRRSSPRSRICRWA